MHFVIILNFAKNGQCITLDAGNVDADSLENWRTIHPENWSNNEVMNWIYSIAEDTEEIDADLLRGEAFSGITGKELSRMSERDFIKLDDKHGSILHQLFSFLNGIGKFKNLVHRKFEAVLQQKKTKFNESASHVCLNLRKNVDV